MKPHADVGLPSLSFEELEQLAEKCEGKITHFILQRIPEKSIEEMSVSCILELNDQLNLDIRIDITQKYETGHELDEIIDEAAEYGSDWLEVQLQEMKAN